MSKKIVAILGVVGAFIASTTVYFKCINPSDPCPKTSTAEGMAIGCPDGDGGFVDGQVYDDSDAPTPDALVAVIDAPVPDAPSPDATVPPDAFVPPLDAYVPPPDAFVPPVDAFVPLPPDASPPDAAPPVPDAGAPVGSPVIVVSTFAPTGSSQPWAFGNVNTTTGIKAAVVAAAGQFGRLFELDINDFDNDGDNDVFVGEHSGILPSEPGSRLFRNNGGLTFTDMTAAAFAGIPTTNQGGGVQDALFADLNGDNLMELVSVANDGNGWAYKNVPNIPFRYTGLTEFPPTQNGPSWSHMASRGVSFGDFDKDGDLDVFTGGMNSGGPPRLYRNNNGTSWTDISSVLTGFPSNLLVNVQPILADFNGDGNLDLLMTDFIGLGLVGPAPAEAHLLFGNGAGGFADVSAASNISAAALINCAIAVGDYDRDGDLDILQIGVPHNHTTQQFIGSQSVPKLLINTNGIFADMTSSAVGLGGPYGGPGDELSWAKGVAEDFDNNGWVDPVMLTGTPLVFRNNGNLNFTRITQAYWNSISITGASLAAADLDQDGDLDFAFTDKQAETGVWLWSNLLNTAQALRIRLDNPNQLNHRGIGSAISIYDAGHIGEAAYLRGYKQVIASANNKVAFEQHFGLPNSAVPGNVDIQVRWPNGGISSYYNVAKGQVVRLTP